MSPLLLGLVVVGGAALAAAGVVLLQQRFSEPQGREGYNEVAGSVFEIVSVLYAIVLAFVLIAVWEQRSEARETTYVESESLMEVYWSAQDLPDPYGAQLEELCEEYAELVVGPEWDQMTHREEVDAQGWLLIDDMQVLVDQGMPEEDRLSLGLAQDAEGSLAQLAEARSERLNANVEGLTGVMWLVLVAGALLMLGILLLFGVPGRLAHLLVVMTAAAMVMLLLFSVYELEYPFGRGIALGPDAYELTLERIRSYG